MTKTRAVESQVSSDLRQRAAQLLRGHIRDPHAPSPEEVEQLVYELEVHRIELEMQTDELRETQQQLEASRDRYADLYEFAPLGYVSLDHHGRIREINHAAAKMLSREGAMAISRHFVGHVAMEHKNTFVYHVRKCVQGQEPVTSEVDLIAKGRPPITVQLDSIAISDPASGVTLCRTAITDITQRKRLEREREKLIADLEAKNTELERFTYTVSHDLKSPVFTIAGYLGMLEGDAVRGNTARIKEDIAEISRAVETMARLLDDLLELSRIGRTANPSQEVAVEELAREAAKLVAGQIARRSAQVEILPDLPVVFGDRARLLEVLQNLIDNAVKFMGDQPQPRIEIGVKQDHDRGEETVCYVRDNGMGIDPRDYDRVFRLFEQLDPRIEGTGVGLALVKRIVEVHGGRTWVESEGHGRGCTFWFALPRKDVADAKAKEAGRAG